MVRMAWRRLGILGLGVTGLAVLMSSQVAAATGTRSSSFAYQASSGLLTQEVVEPATTALKVTTAYTYDAFGNKTAATVSGVDIATRTSSTAYDAKGQFPTTVTNALNQSETWTYDPKFGQPLTQTGPNGLTTSWQYDVFGRKTLEIRPDGTRTKFTYLYCSGTNGGTATCPQYATYVTTATPLASDGVTQNGPGAQTYFDSLDRAVASDVQGFSGATIRTATQYDGLGRVWKVSRPYFLSGGTPKWIVNQYGFNQFGFDTLGRLMQTTLPDGSKATYAYHGLTTSETNDKNQTKTTVLNAQGLVASVTDEIGKVTAYAYDAFGNLTRTTDSAGNVATATYDARGRKIAMHDPDMGNWSYTYDVLDELKTQTDAKSQVTTLTYDKLGRITQRVEPGLTSNWVYDTAPMGVGKLASATTDHGYSRLHFYDGQGRPSQTTITILGDTSSISTFYDANGRVNQVAYPSGFMVQYSYNATGYLAQLKDANTAQVYWTANTYDAELNPTSATAGNGVVTNRTFDPNTGLLTGIQAGLGATPTAVANFSYSFDTLGNLLARADINQGLNESFAYDGLNRLTQYQIVGGAAKTVAYDNLGNIVAKSDVGTYSYPLSGVASVRPHAVSAITPSGTGTVATSFTYDANGNMTAGMGRTTAWTSFNMVASIVQGTKTVTFDYDADHARMRQGAASGTTLYLADPGSGLRVEKVTGATGNVQWNEYLFAGGEMVGEHFTTIAGAMTTSATRYFVADHLGSIAVITDEAGTVVERLSYDAWGKRRFPTGADDPTGSIASQTTRGFTGHEMIDEVGLVNMNGRVYDPQIGRFMSADPFIQDPTNSQSLNRYTYVGNNPLSYTDPSGYFFKKLFKKLKNLFKSIVKSIVGLFKNPRLLLGLAVGAALVFALGPEGLALNEFLVAGVSGGVAGFISTGTLKGALIGAGTAIAFAGVGQLKQAVRVSRLEGSLLHGAVGGASSVVQGGKFGPGFLSAGVSEFAGPEIRDVFGDDFAGKLVGHATLGGIAAELGGGKFGNGFTTAAFGYLFNEALHQDGDAVRGYKATFYNDGTVCNLNGSGCFSEALGHPISPFDFLAGGVVGFVRGVGRLFAGGGTQLFRVFGNEAQGLGNYYTTVNPGTVADFRTTAGLFPGNSGSFVLEGTLNNTEGVIFRSAAPGPGGVGGGLPEVFVPNPATQVIINRVSGVNPPF